MAVSPEEVEHREVGRRLAVGDRRTFEHEPSLGTVGMHKLIDQARFPNPGLSHYRRHLPMPRTGLLQGLLQRLQLMVPSDKPAQPTRRSRLQAPADSRDPDQLEHLHGLCQALDGDRSQGVHPYQPFHQPQRRGRQQDAARGGELFHAGRQVRRLAHSRVIHVQIIANGAHHHLTRVEPDTHLHRQSLRAPHLLSIALHGRLHGERGIAGPCGVILMRHGRPKQGHNAIAQHLVHGAFVAVHGLHHQVQGRVEEVSGRFRVEAGNQLRRAFDIGKQHRDLLALAFQGSAGSEDFLREMRRSICQRRTALALGLDVSAGSAATSPDQHCAVLIDSEALPLDDFVFQVVEVSIIEIELPLESAISQAATALQHGNSLLQDLLERHRCPSISGREPLSGLSCSLYHKGGKHDQYARFLEDISTNCRHTISNVKGVLFGTISYLNIDNIVFTADGFRRTDRLRAHRLEGL